MLTEHQRALIDELELALLACGENRPSSFRLLLAEMAVAREIYNGSRGRTEFDDELARMISALVGFGIKLPGYNPTYAWNLISNNKPTENFHY